MSDTGSFKAIARARARSLTQWPLLVVLAIVTVGLALVVIGHWRRGSAVIGAALCLGAAERALLPKETAGLLQVRNKPFDVTFLLATGLGILALAFLVPGPDGTPAF